MMQTPPTTRDALGRLWHVTVDRRNGNIIFGTPEVTTYAYDGIGDLASVTLPSNDRTLYQYDGLNRLTVEKIERFNCSRPGPVFGL